VPARAEFDVRRWCGEIVICADPRRLRRGILSEFDLRVAVRAGEEVAPAAVGLKDRLTDESPAVTCDAQRWLVELVHDPSTALRALASSMMKVSVDEPALLRRLSSAG